MEKIQLKVSKEVIDFIQCFHGIYNEGEGYHYGIFNWFKIDEENETLEIVDDVNTNKKLSKYFEDVNYVGLYTPFQIKILSNKLNGKEENNVE